MINAFFTAIIAHGDTIVVAIVAIILGWDRLKSGSSNLRKEITDDYKERNGQLEEKVTEMQKELTHVHNNQKQKKELDDQMALVKVEEEKKKDAQFSELKGKYDSVIEILQGRNTEMDSVIKNAPQTFGIAADTNKVVKETYGVVVGIADNINKIAQKII